MKIYRKPYTAEWHYKSAQLVNNISFTINPWTNGFEIEFDATMDKSGERHTTMKISLDENEIEHLYNQLLQGRKDKIEQLEEKLKNYENALNKEWEKATILSDEYFMLKELKRSL